MIVVAILISSLTAFGLTERRPALDTQAAEIADSQDISAQSRRKLAEDTRGN